MNCSTPGLPVHHQLPEFTQTHVHRVSDAILPSNLCRPFLLLPPILPSIRVFPNESTLRMRCPKYWSVSFSISPSKEHPGLISFRMDWLVSLIFLKRSLVFLILLFSSISLHWLLRKAFLSLQAILWNSAFKWAHLSFSPLLLASFLFIATCKASSDSHLSFASDSKQNLFVS